MSKKPEKSDVDLSALVGLVFSEGLDETRPDILDSIFRLAEEGTVEPLEMQPMAATSHDEGQPTASRATAGKLVVNIRPLRGSDDQLRLSVKLNDDDLSRYVGEMCTVEFPCGSVFSLTLDACGEADVVIPASIDRASWKVWMKSRGR